MITVWIDRGSVGMGDSATTHVMRRELPDDATPADVLLHAVDSGHLPSVAGEVSWYLRIGHARLSWTDDVPSLAFGRLEPLALHHRAELVPEGAERDSVLALRDEFWHRFVALPYFRDLQIGPREWAVSFTVASTSRLYTVPELRRRIDRFQHRVGPPPVTESGPGAR